MSILSVILIAVLVSLAYYKNQQAKSQAIMLQLTADQSCDLQKTDCTLAWDKGNLPTAKEDLSPAKGFVTLSITPRPIPLVKPIQISVQLKNLSNIEAVAVDFKGTTMNMGPNNVKLTLAENNTWRGSGMLPVCIRNQMEWQADVYLQTPQGIIVAPFIFLTRKHY